MREIKKDILIPQPGVVDPAASPPLEDLSSPQKTPQPKSTHRASKVGTIVPKPPKRTAPAVFMPSSVKKSSANAQTAIEFALMNCHTDLVWDGTQEYENQPWSHEARVFWTTFRASPSVAEGLMAKLAATTLDASGKNSNRRAEEIAIDNKLHETISDLIAMKIKCAKEAASMVGASS